MGIEIVKLELIKAILNTNDFSVLNNIKEVLLEGNIVNESEAIYVKEKRKNIKSVYLIDLNKMVDTSEKEYEKGNFTDVNDLISKYS